MNPATLAGAYTVRVLESVLNQSTATALSQTLTPGATLSAKVLQSAPQQTTLSVAGKALAFDLPGQWSVGQELQLTYLGGDKQPKFLMMGQPAAAPSEQLALSNTAQTLRDLASLPNAVASALRPTATFPENAGSASQMATFLQNTLEFSGVFYESHLASWSHGQWSVQNLLAEPQNAGKNPAPGKTGNVEMHYTPASSSPASIASSPSLDGAQNSKQGVTTYTQIADLTAGRNASVISTLNPGSLQTLGQQIQTLNQQQFVWTGPVWPGQQATWMVKRREEDSPESQQKGEKPSGQRWESALALDLPHLGHVEARLQLRQSTLRLLLTTEQEALLRAHWEELTQSLQHLGLQVAAAQIRSSDESAQG